MTRVDRSERERVFAGVAPVVLVDEPLARHNTWRIGGTADVFVAPTSAAQVKDAIDRARRHGLSWFVLGRGSNLLVRDGGIRGLVLKLGDGFAEWTVADARLTALAGRGMVSAANIAIRHGLSGLQFATGIPGTVGGAVTMNAGANGGEIRDVLERATILEQGGEIVEWSKEEFAYAYRHSSVKERGVVVLSATFSLQAGDVEEMTRQVQKWGLRRKATQPLSLPSCGSVFRNPAGNHAARLIEGAGLKGLRIGDAAVSDLHANFIVNLGQARAVDVLALIERVQREVLARFDVPLVPEVQVVGEDETRG